MNSESFRQRFQHLQQADETIFQAAEHNMNAVINETFRVAELSHNASQILEDLDERFCRETHLTPVDMTFLFTAIGLQIARQHLLNKLTTRVDDQTAAKSAPWHTDEHSNRHHRYYNPSLDEICTNPVPFDANIGANGALSGGGKFGHRATAIGHDPLLGLVVGTANIATSTLTNSRFQSYHISTKNNRDYFRNRAQTSLVLQKTGEKLLSSGLDGKAKVGASLMKEIGHLGTDIYTKNSLPLPIISVINPKVANDLALYGLDMANVVTVGMQVTFSALINSIIAMIHGLFFDGESVMDRKLYEVRTRKILSYSNLVASSYNLGLVAFIGDLSSLDVGGLAVTIYRLITDRKFIRKVQDEFLFGSFNEMIQGDSLDLKDYNYNDILDTTSTSN